MPDFSYEPRTSNDKSQLTEGWHPAYLLAITDEETPAMWKMAEQSPRMWRWHMAVWESPAIIQRLPPEHQSAPTSQKFSPGGKFQPSKAYVWTCELLGRQIQPGERVTLDPLLPLPCRVKIRRNNEYANIVDLEKWPDGQQALTPELKAQLEALLTMPPAQVSPQAAVAQPVAATSNGQGWGQQQPVATPQPQPATVAKPTW